MRAMRRTASLRPVVLSLLVGLPTGTTSTHAQVQDLTLAESGDHLILDWNGADAPYRVLRSASPNFYFGNHIVADDLVATSAQDVNALRPGNHSYFYDIRSSSQSNPPGMALNPPSAVAPTITGINPGSGEPGDLVTISGNDFVADGSRMTVTFHHAIAELVSATATDLQVVVPLGAYTGDVVVCIATDICSNPFPFDVTYGPAFQDISSIAYESATGSLWVADRGSADTIYEIDATGTLISRGTLAQPILGHPSPAGNARVYYCNSVNSDFNIGTIRYIDPDTDAEEFFDNAGQSGGSSTPVRCEGIAANDLEPEVAYYLDGRGNTIRKIVRDALAHDLSYGDQPFSFNSPSGARFDSSGNLYISSTTATYRILPSEAGVELVATGFTAAAGIDLIELAESTYLAVADEAAGVVWLVNALTGVKLQVEAGLAGPLGVVFSDDPVIGKTGLYVAEPTRILRLPDPRLTFPVEFDQRILLSKSWSSDVYPSPHQGDDGEITVRVRLNPVIDPTGMSAFFRLIDPLDPSGYIVGATAADNRPSSPGGSLTTQASFDVNGLAVTTLSVNNQHSGNNYQVEASLAGGPDFRPLAISPVYTTWRRAYIEHDYMWRTGAWIVSDAGANEPDSMRIQVSDSSVFAIGDDIQVLSGATFDTAQGEFGTVLAVGPGYIDIDTDPGPDLAGLRNQYPGNSPDADPFSYVANVALGVFGAAPDTSRLAVAFDDAFADWIVLPIGGFVPTWPQVPSGAAGASYINERGPLFFNASTAPGRPAILNTVHFISAADGPALGQSLSTTGLNWTWLFNDRIAASFPGAIDSVRESVGAHELAHQYDVNAGDPLGHDEGNAWTPAGTLCLMNVSRDRTLGVVKMHGPSAGATQDLMCVRTHIDDLDSSSLCTGP